MKYLGYIYKTAMICTWMLFMSVGSLYAQTSAMQEDHSTSGIHKAEELWGSVDFVKFKREVALHLKLSDADASLFFQYTREMFVSYRSQFFQRAVQGSLDQNNLEADLESLRLSYYTKYEEFLSVKKEFAKQFLIDNPTNTLAANGPCTNVDFETGTRNGWVGYTADACTSPTPCNVNTGFSATRTVITNTTMTDPYIPTLPVVAPGGNYSLRLENYLNGGDAAIVRQTFQVSASNNVFTYRYAAVLEDPGSHSDSERPYFKVRLYDQQGREIQCASYTAIAKPPIQNYQYEQVPNPNPGMNGSGNFLNLYYRNWTTISIPLMGYVGQNVTIEFTASDCSLGGHLGYAYIDAECMAVGPIASPTICGNQSVTITTASGFAGYSWTGPGIVGSTTTQTITVNKPGVYTVTLTPFSDDPCPVSLTFNVYEHCDPPPVSTSLCETVQGAGTATNVNLNTYTTLVTAYHAPPGTVVSWHTGLPATTFNKILSPTNVTLSNLQKIYAVISYTTIGGDTVELNININPKPVITFPNVASVCQGSAAFQITGVTPAGGIFSGPHVTASGMFNPTTVGDFTIQYAYTNANGCSNTAAKVVHVQIPPTVNAGPPQTICASAGVIVLNGSSTNTSSTVWSGGGGTYAPNANTLNATYTPSASEISSGSVTLTLTGNGISPCAAVSQQVTFTIIPMPTVNAGAPQTICASTGVIALNGSSTNTSSIMWNGGGGTYAPNAATLNASYTPSAAEFSSGGVTLTLTGNGNSPCAAVSRQVHFTLVPVPTVSTTPQTVCASNGVVTLTGSSTNTSSVLWSGGGGTYAPNASTLNAAYTPSASELAAGLVTLTLRGNGISPCAAVSKPVTFTFVPIATVNAGAPQTICASAGVIVLNGSSTNTSSIVWSGGVGTYAPNANTLNATYTPSASEISSGGVTLTLTGNGNSPCTSVSQQVHFTIIKVPTVNTTAQTICASAATIALTGSSTNTSSVLWSGGGGTYTPNATTLNTTYTPSAAEFSAGSVTLTLTGNGNTPCAAVSRTVTFTIVPAATVSAGSPQTICANAGVIVLNGSSANTSSVVWSGGAGAYAPNQNTLNATYTPSVAEVLSGGVTLTLTGNGNNPCTSVSQQVHFTIIKVPTVNTTAQTICASAGTIALTGSSTNTSSIAWSGGGGTYAPNSTTLNTAYTPSASEFSAGSVTLTLTGNGNSPCAPVSKSVTFTIVPVATVNAGTPQTICASAGTIVLNGSSANTSSVVWSGGAGTYAPNKNTLNATYTPSASEFSSGTVTLTLTGNGNAPCASVSQQVQFTIIAVPAVNTTAQTICASAGVIVLTGSSTNTSSISWSGGGGTYAPDANTINATYTPSAAEFSAGSVTLTLTGNGNAPCAAVSKSVTFTIVPVATVNAGSPQTICASSSMIVLNGSSAHTTSISWSGGTGTYTPDANILNANYTPSASELSLGSVTLTLTGNGIAPCAAVSQQVTFTIIPVPSVNAGPPQTLCVSAGAVNLNGSSVNTSLTVWSGGAGTYSPDANTLTATYTPTASEFSVGILTLTLTGNGNSPCAPVSQPVQFNFVPVPTINAGPDQSICANVSVVNLHGAETNSAVASWSGGAGSYAPDRYTLNTTYTPTASEVTSGAVTLTLTAQGFPPCASVTDEMMVSIHPLPVANMPKEIKYCGDTEASVTLNAGVADHYLWTPTNETTQIIVVSTPGIYTVTVYTQHNCSASASVKVREVCPPRLYISDAFTPNTDTTNDLYNVYGAHIGAYRMLIFNRWGEIIFESKERLHVWDGKYRGEPMPEGVYPWVITYEGDTEEYRGPYKLEGSVTVIR